MPTTRRSIRWILWIALPFVGLFLFKLFLSAGPGWLNQKNSAPPGLFAFHARALIQAELGFPRTLEGFIPAPNRGSSQALQLGGLGWWDGHGWTASALALGRSEGKGLFLPLGRLSILDVAEASPARDYNGIELCQVDYTVRWDVPADLQQLVNQGALTGLHLPEGLDLRPGGTESMQVTFQRKGFGWKLVDADHWRKNAPGHPMRTWTWLTFIL